MHSFNQSHVFFFFFCLCLERGIGMEWRYVVVVGSGLEIGNRNELLETSCWRNVLFHLIDVKAYKKSYSSLKIFYHHFLSTDSSSFQKLPVAVDWSRAFIWSFNIQPDKDRNHTRWQSWWTGHLKWGNGIKIYFVYRMLMFLIWFLGSREFKFNHCVCVFFFF